MNTPLLPVGMDHSHTSTIHLTTISSSMLVSDMMPPKHLHALRGEMSMQLLVLRISTLFEESHETHLFQDIDTPPDDFYQIHQTKQNRNPPHPYLASRKTTPESLFLLHPRNHLLLRNMMDLCMSLLRFINSLALKLLLPSRNTILKLSIEWPRKGESMSLMSLIMDNLLLRLRSLKDKLTLTKMMMHLKMKLIPF